MPSEGYDEAREFAAWVDGLVAQHGRARALAVVDAVLAALSKEQP